MLGEKTTTSVLYYPHSETTLYDVTAFTIPILIHETIERMFNFECIRRELLRKNWITGRELRIRWFDCIRIGVIVTEISFPIKSRSWLVDHLDYVLGRRGLSQQLGCHNI